MVKYYFGIGFSFLVVLIVLMENGIGFSKAYLGEWAMVLVFLSAAFVDIVINRKKNANLVNRQLQIIDGSKIIQVIDLTSNYRVVLGMGGVKIIGSNGVNYFRFSQFDKRSIALFKKLGA